MSHPQTNPWCQKRLGTAVLESAFQCLGFLEFAGPAFSRCVPYHNMEDAGLNICVWVCVGVCGCVCVFFLVCLCLVAHIETICLETLIPFRLHFLFKASFMFLVCMICHQAFPCVFNDDHSYCEMSSCDSLSVALLFICHPSRLICHCSIQILHPLTRNYGKPWLTNSKVSTPCKPAECPDLPVSSPEVS